MIYLNNAASSFPKPQAVIKAVYDYINSIPVNTARVGFVKQDHNAVDICREQIAQLFNIKDPNNIMFTSGSTESLNLALFGLNLKGKHVITTAIDHNSVLRPLKTMEKQRLIQLSIVECDQNGYVKPKEIESHIRKNTKVIVVNHCSNVTGEILDIKAIARIAHKKEIIFIIDASQSAGCIPLDIQDSKVDIVAFTGHKSLYGLPGIGGIYIKDNLPVKPLKVGGTGIRSDLLFQPEERPIYYEAGTQNMPGIISLKAGVEFILKTSMKKIQLKKEQHLKKILAELSEIPQLVLYGRKDIHNRVPVFCFNVKGMLPEDVGYILEKSFNIVVRSGLHCAPLIHKALNSYPKGSIRVSPSYFTKAEEINHFIKAVKKICNAK